MRDARELSKKFFSLLLAVSESKTKETFAPVRPFHYLHLLRLKNYPFSLLGSFPTPSNDENQ
jgi:hypothetical protein